MGVNEVNSNYKPIILIVESHELSRLSYENETSRQLLLNPNIHVIGLPGQDADQKILSKLGSQLSRSGTTAVQSPYNKNRYSESSEALLEFSVEKFTLFSRVCGLLGAKRVEIKQIITNTLTENITAALTAVVTKVSGKLDVELEQMNKFKNSLQLNYEFEGGEARLDETLKLIKKHNLNNDLLFQDVFAQRQIGRINKQEVILNITTETKRTLEIATNLKFPTFLSNVEGKLKHISKQIRDYQLKISVEF